MSMPSFKIIWKEMSENNDLIHVYNPGTGADSPLESKGFQKYEYSVNLLQVFSI